MHERDAGGHESAILNVNDALRCTSPRVEAPDAARPDAGRPALSRHRLAGRGGRAARLARRRGRRACDRFRARLRGRVADDGAQRRVDGPRRVLLGAGPEPGPGRRGLRGLRRDGAGRGARGHRRAAGRVRGTRLGARRPRRRGLAPARPGRLRELSHRARRPLRAAGVAVGRAPRDRAAPDPRLADVERAEPERLLVAAAVRGRIRGADQGGPRARSGRPTRGRARSSPGSRTAGRRCARSTRRVGGAASTPRPSIRTRRGRSACRGSCARPVASCGGSATGASRCG